MALLSAAMRASAITGSSRPIGAWMQGRQWGRWGDQWVEQSHPHAATGPPRPAPPPGDPAASLEHLRAAGIIDDAELARLRARVRRPA